MKKLLIMLLLALPMALSASSNKFGAFDNLRLQSFYENSSLKDLSTLAGKNLQYPFYSKDGQIRVKLLIKYNDVSVLEKVLNHDGRVLVKTKTIAAIDIPAQSLYKVVENVNVSRIELSKQIKALNNEGMKEIRADLAHTGEGLDHAYKGEGVIVGIVDTGIDFKHPDFSDENGTRIQSIYDLSEDYDATNYPNDNEYGRLYDKEMIDNNVANVLEKDYHGHGTHVAGTAAGNGSANLIMTGAAPKADIVFVKGVTKESQSFPEEHIIMGCQYIFDYAEYVGKPAVINLSLGSIIGPHDGSTLYEQALSELVKPGHLIIAAAGNDGTTPLHAGGISETGKPLAFPISPFINVCDIFDGFCPDDPNYFMTAGDMWYSAGTVDSITIAALRFDGSGIEIAQKISTKVGVSITDKELKLGSATIGYVTINNDNAVDANNGDGEIIFQIHNSGNLSVAVYDYYWMVILHGKNGVKADTWAGIPVPSEQLSFFNFPEYTLAGGDLYQTIGSPATAKKIIAVASYTSKNSWIDVNNISHNEDKEIGNRSSFSSVGPTRDGRNGVHVSAPGEIIFSALSSDMPGGGGSDMILLGGQYQGMQGTSMATPHVAGAVALMLQVKPDLSFEELEQVLNNTSRPFEGQDGIHPAVGAGKLDVHAALQSLESTDVEYIESISNSRVYPIPSSNEVNLEFAANQTPNALEIYSSIGTLVKNVDIAKLRNNNNWYFVNESTSGLESGLYFFKVTTNGKYNTLPFVVSK